MVLAMVANRFYVASYIRVAAYHTRTVCFSVPYAYGGTVRVYVSHSIKLAMGTGGFMPKAYYSKASPKGYVRYSFRFIIS